jgi:hypothetical protein
LAAPSPAFTLDQGRIRLGDDLFVYLERMLAPPGSLPVDVAPRAYGVAPTAVLASGSVLAAVGPGEAVWLGLQPVDAARPALVRVRIDHPEPLDAVTGEPWEDAMSEEPRNYLSCPPDSRLAGVRDDWGYVPFGLRDRGASAKGVLERLSVLSYGDEPALAPVELVTPERFTSLTGIVPEPLDPDSAYKGWRLP